MTTHNKTNEHRQQQTWNRKWEWEWEWERERERDRDEGDDEEDEEDETAKRSALYDHVFMM